MWLHKLQALQVLKIANVCNEAALIAARRNKDAVDMQDFSRCSRSSYRWSREEK